MKCEKCGREHPDNLTQPVRCLYSSPKKDLSIVSSSDFFKKLQETNPNVVNNNLSLIDSQRKLWEELHTYKWVSEQETEQWFHFFCSRVPCGECKMHWLNLVSNFPPQFNSAEAFFEWSVLAHNKVNERLEKPQISLDEARRLWLKA